MTDDQVQRRWLARQACTSALSGTLPMTATGQADSIAEAKAWRHRYGGNVFQQWPAGRDVGIGHCAAQARFLHRPRADGGRCPDRRAGRDRASQSSPCPQFQLWVRGTAAALEEANLALAESEQIWFLGGWRDRPPTGLAMTEVTVHGPALSWSAEQVTETAPQDLSALTGRAPTAGPGVGKLRGRECLEED